MDSAVEQIGGYSVIRDNFAYFSIKTCGYSLELPTTYVFMENWQKLSFNYHKIPSLSVLQTQSYLGPWVPTTYVFMENWQKLSFNYHKIPSLSVLQTQSYLGPFETFFCMQVNLLSVENRSFTQNTIVQTFTQQWTATCKTQATLKMRSYSIYYMYLGSDNLDASETCTLNMHETHCTCTC